MEKIASVIMILSVLLIAGCSRYCQDDSDCVPATCCHPDQVTNKDNAPDCDKAGCTSGCEGPLDCGCGRPACVKNECVIQKLSSESYCP